VPLAGTLALGALAFLIPGWRASRWLVAVRP
jgi:hypothetical protein